MVATRQKRAASAENTAAKKTKSDTPGLPSASPAAGKFPIAAKELEKKKLSLKKVPPPRASPNVGLRVPHPNRLESAKTALKKVIPRIKTDVVVVLKDESTSPKKAASSPSKSPKSSSPKRP
ncbi:hypothetical protein HDU83_006317 [Entophlyctis luteolus]|nr:hypothetical protein HDU82_008129 [Entophlyctis luteolus]KAJ3353825.1 hypothetical protein HDU83_006317 [Entophlyctis luteolus]KAJ3392771.1 hypothetical protein HDU84_003508 [Entophlyctis sp. JEL0112]